jgi:hypothetical protein
MTILPSQAQPGDVVSGAYILDGRVVRVEGVGEAVTITFADGSVLNTGDAFPIEVERS